MCLLEFKIKDYLSSVTQVFVRKYALFGLITLMCSAPGSRIVESSAAGFDKLVVASETKLVEVNLLDFKSHYLLTNVTHAFDIDVFNKESYSVVYWSDFEEGKIYSGTLIQNEFREISVFAEFEKKSVEGIAVDWLAENLYWVNRDFQHIEVRSLRNQKNGKIIITDIEKPRAIAVDPNLGLLFWSDWNAKKPCIERSTMAGEHRTVVVNIDDFPKGGFPNGITLDTLKKKLYWIDAKSESIHFANYDGSEIHEITAHSSFIRRPFGITFYNNTLFWADAYFLTVSMISVTNTSDIKVAYKGNNGISGVAVIPDRINTSLGESPNPCKNNGNCSHICLLNGQNSRKCECPFLMEIDSSGQNCKFITNLALVIKQNSAEASEIMTYNKNYSKQLLPRIVIKQSLENLPSVVDIRQCLVYWADENFIWQTSCYGGGNKKFVNLYDDRVLVTNLAVDQKVGTLFYSDNNGPTIKAKLDGRYFDELLHFEVNDRLKSLTCSSTLRKLFWILQSKNRNSSIIQMSNLDGSGLQTLYQKECNWNEKCILDLSVNPTKPVIYWTENANNGTVIFGKDINNLTDIISRSFFSFKIDKFSFDNEILCLIPEERFPSCGTLNESSFLFTASNESSFYTSLNTMSFDPLNDKSPCEIENGGCSETESCSVSLDDVVTCVSSFQMDDTSKSLQTDQSYYTTEEDATENSPSPPHLSPTSCEANCLNGGSCSVGSDGLSHCICAKGYQGQHCEISICQEYCINGRCTLDLYGKPLCICKLGFKGERCDKSLCSDFCLEGSCYLSPKGYPKCSCPPDWTGERCQLRIATNGVVSTCNVCQNGGTCVSVDDRTLCLCMNNYTGTRCQTYIVNVDYVDMTCDRHPCYSFLIAFIVTLCVAFVLLTSMIYYLVFRPSVHYSKEFELESIANSCVKLHFGNKHRLEKFDEYKSNSSNDATSTLKAKRRNEEKVLLVHSTEDLSLPITENCDTRV